MEFFHLSDSPGLMFDFLTDWFKNGWERIQVWCFLLQSSTSTNEVRKIYLFSFDRVLKFARTSTSCSFQVFAFFMIFVLREHLGLLECDDTAQDSLVDDPISESFFKVCAVDTVKECHFPTIAIISCRETSFSLKTENCSMHTVV
jgi:hypothetical protein